MTQERRELAEQRGQPAESREAPEQQDTRYESSETLIWWRADARTFIMNVWVFLAFILYFVWDYIKNALTSNEDYLQVMRRLPEYLLGMAEHSPVTFYTLCVVALLSFGGSVLSWFATRYSVGEHSVYRHSGILFKKQRQIRLESVQSIDISRSLVARILGVSELRLEVADGVEEALHIKYLAHAKARDLQERLLRRASTLRTADTPDSADASTAHTGRADVPKPAGEPEAGTASAASNAERSLFKVPNMRVISAIVLSSALWAVPVAMIWVGGTMIGWLANPAKDQVQISQFILPALIPILGYLWHLWSNFDQGANFTVERIRQSTPDARGDSLRLTYGFTGTHTQTLFPSRIQAVKIEQPLLWKPFGWYRVMVNIAGMAVNKDASSSELFTRNTALPVGTAEEVQQLLHLLLPSLPPQNTAPVLAVMDSSMRNPADGRELGVIAAPRRARWLSPLAYRRDGFARVSGEDAPSDTSASTDDMEQITRVFSHDLLLLRGGFFVRFLSIVPERQVLAARWSQGPLDRILNIARISLGSVPGPVRPVVQHLDAREAERIAADVTARADGTRPYHRVEG